MALATAPSFIPIPAVRLCYNVGGLFDIPTGEFLKGKHGEMVLNGGLGSGTGFAGKNNLGKSTLMHSLNGVAMERYSCDPRFMGDSPEGFFTGMTYDTEVNTTPVRFEKLARQAGFDDARNPILTGQWILTDKTVYHGNVWFDMYKDFVKFKIDHSKKLQHETPFLDRDGSYFKTLIPTFVEIDSLSEFDTENIVDIKDKTEVGSKDRLTIYMKQGLGKHGMIGELPRLIAQGSTPMSATVHIGKEIEMDPNAPPKRVFMYLPQGDTIKGVPGNFNYLVTVLWHIVNSQLWLNDSTKESEYPAGPDDDMQRDTDLNIVTINLLRNKFGRSGQLMQVFCSQEKGLLRELSEFHYCKVNNRWGFTGDNTNYRLVFCPDIALSRKQVRTKIDKHPELRRALNILAETLQMKNLWTDEENVFCSPEELYEDLKAMGYDWPTLLNTRGYWVFDNDKHPIPFLSSLDLLRMRRGLYTPYWWDTKKFPIDMSKAKKA